MRFAKERITIKADDRLGDRPSFSAIGHDMVRAEAPPVPEAVGAFAPVIRSRGRL